jgi:small subunit ribosomal protein S16
MPVKIRLQRHGRKKAPFYHIVAADSRAPRDGKFIEKLGSYNPLTKPATIEIDRDKAFSWLEKGAQPTDTVRAILRFKGVMYRTHLMRGVKKGALSVEQAAEKLAQWIEAKELNIETRRQQTEKEKLAFHAAVSGKPKDKKVKAAAETAE